MKGLYQKYIIKKANGKPLDPNFEAIVLRIDGGQYVDACRAGAFAFAQSVKKHNPLLADDIKNKLREYFIEEEQD